MWSDFDNHKISKIILLFIKPQRLLSWAVEPIVGVQWAIFGTVGEIPTPIPQHFTSDHIQLVSLNIILNVPIIPTNFHIKFFAATPWLICVCVSMRMWRWWWHNHNHNHKLPQQSLLENLSSSPKPCLASPIWTMQPSIWPPCASLRDWN